MLDVDVVVALVVGVVGSLVVEAAMLDDVVVPGSAMTWVVVDSAGRTSVLDSNVQPTTTATTVIARMTLLTRSLAWRRHHRSRI